MNRRGKVIALSTVAVGVVVLVAAGIAVRGRIVEGWWIWKVEKGDASEREAAAERLGEMQSVRSVPALIKADLLFGGWPYMEALTKIGAPAVPALVTELKSSVSRENLPLGRGPGEILQFMLQEERHGGGARTKAIEDALKEEPVLRRALRWYSKVDVY